MPHSLEQLDTCSLVGGAVCGGLGGVALVEEVCSPKGGPLTLRASTVLPLLSACVWKYELSISGSCLHVSYLPPCLLAITDTFPLDHMPK